MDHLVPTAVNSPLIMNCVLGVAAVHLARCEGHVGSLDTVACVHYGSAIHTLRDTLTLEPLPEKTEKQDETLLAILLLLFYEVRYHLLPSTLHCLMTDHLLLTSADQHRT